MDSAPTHSENSVTRRAFTANKELTLLVIPMALAVTLSALFALFTLYQDELDQQTQRLNHSVELEKSILESEAAKASNRDSTTLFNHYASHPNLPPLLYESHEEILAQRGDDRFNIFIHRHIVDEEATISQSETDTSPLFTITTQDQALRRATEGERGSAIFTDYRGHQALIAYTSVEIFNERYALIAKTDLADIRWPYLAALLLIFGITSLVAIVAIPTFARLINPVLARLQDAIAKQREDRLELKKLASIIEESPASILITDLEHRIEYVNPAFVVNSGYSEAEIIGQNVRILQSGYTPQTVYQEMFSTIKAGRSWRGELLNRKKNGELFWESTTISPIRNHDERISHYAAIKEDITDRKQAEEELRRHRDHLQELVAEQTANLVAAKEEAEAANLAKSSFLANTSHEIRTPMNAIIGMSELLLETSLTDEQRNYLTTVAKSARALLELLNQILDLSKLESGKMTLEQIPFDLHETVKEAFNTFHASAKSKNIALQLDIEESIQPCRIGDPTRLRQVIINLVGNALKFTQKGYIRLSVRPEGSSGRLHFSVTDTGIGIPADRLEHIFESFTQADQSTVRKHGGTGLGTTISKQFVELMNGRIWVESEEGVGSTFHFTIDSPEADEVTRSRYQKSCQKQSWRALRPLNILLADDVEENIELATIRLEQRHHVVTAARNGQEALHRYLLGHFDIILMDIQMPKMNGFETTAEIRKREQSGDKHIPIIAMTASILKQDQDKCIAAGVDAVVGKPIDFEVLHRIMASLLPEAFEQRTAENEVIPDTLDRQNQLITIDLDTALDIWGEEAVYRKALHHFFQHNQQTLDQIQNNITHHHIDAARELTHKIKGVAGNLALKALEEITRKLDNLLKKGDLNATQALLPQLTSKWKMTLAEVNNYLADDDTHSQASLCDPPPIETAHYIDALLDGLDCGDPDKVEKIIEQIKTLICPEKLATIEHHIFEFNFSVAATEVVKLAKELDIDVKGKER